MPVEAQPSVFTGGGLGYELPDFLHGLAAFEQVRVSNRFLPQRKSGRRSRFPFHSWFASVYSPKLSKFAKWVKRNRAIQSGVVYFQKGAKFYPSSEVHAKPKSGDLQSHWVPVLRQNRLRLVCVQS